MSAPASLPAFRKPNPVEKVFNWAFGMLVGLGLGMPHNYLLQVRGRKSGRTYSTPVNVLFVGPRGPARKSYLVAPRGRTQWVRNAEAAGEIILRKAWIRRVFRLRPISDDDKPELLKTYAQRFALTVQRYFPIPAGSELQAFRAIAANYPVFELLPA
jgi:deazaflavin-dependent oxidoreductase (nitroreductase family)